MSVTESKHRNGTLTLGGTSFACQATNVEVQPGYEESGDTLEVLCGDELTPEERRTNTLHIETVQDFEDAAGFQRYTWTNDLVTVAFVWAPQGAEGPSIAGTVKVKAVKVGGAVGPARLFTEGDWKIVTLGNWTDPA